MKKCWPVKTFGYRMEFLANFEGDFCGDPNNDNKQLLQPCNGMVRPFATNLRGRQFRYIHRLPLSPRLIVVGVVVTYLLGVFLILRRISATQSIVDANLHQHINAQPAHEMPAKEFERKTLIEPIRNIEEKKDSSRKTPNDAIATIGYAISVTGCGSDPITEGGAVLKHSVHLTSVHGNMGGKYDYKFYAIYHPDAETCAMTLQDLGYEMVKRETPVAVQDIKGEYLRTHIERNGCCGEKELIKLEAYTFTDHPIVVHLDLDVLILKPLDPIFDLMLAKNPKDSGSLSDVPIMWPDTALPSKINVFFTRDYNMAIPHKKYKPVQGGFLVLRPDMKVYQDYVNIIREGDFRKGSGWGGATGVFYGSMTFQGIVPFYYDVLHPGQSIELNRCLYNQMCDNPRDGKTVNDVVHGKCRTGQDECEDCRSRPLEDVVTVHYTLCQKPWICLAHDKDSIQQRLCKKILHEWFRIRSDMEKYWGRSGMGTGEWNKDHFFGYCTRSGKGGYQNIATPYGKP